MRRNLLRLWQRLLAGASLGGLCWAIACSPVFGQASSSSSSSGTSPSSSSQPSDDTTQGTSARSSDQSRPGSATRPTTDPTRSGSASRSGDTTRSSSQSRSSGVFDQDSSDTTRSGRQSSDTSSESRDSGRDADRESQEDQDEFRSSQQRGRSATQSGRDSQRDASRQSSEEFEDLHQPSQGSSRSSRDSARDDSRSARDSSRDQEGSRRDTSRDDQSFSRSQRDDSRDDQGYSRSQRDTAREQRDSYDRDSYQRDDRQFSRDDRDQRADYQDSRRDSRDDYRSTSRASYSESRSSDVDFRAEDVRSADIGLWFNRSNRDGLVISDVSSSGAITRFGFREGDQVMSVNGWRVDDESTFIEYLFDPEIRNQRVEVLVWRGGRQVPLYVQPSTLVQEYTSASTQSDPLEEYGLVLDDRYPSNTVVWKVMPRTPAFYAGIRPGDTIVSWGGYRVSNPQQFTTFVQRGWSGPIDLQVSRNRQMRQIQLDMDQGARRTALRPGVRTDVRGNVDVDRLLPGREGRIENRIERREGIRDGGYGVQGGYQLQGGTYGTPTYGTQGTFQDQPGVIYGSGTYQGQPGVQAGAEVRPGILPPRLRPGR